jgi:hypothetical protein
MLGALATTGYQSTIVERLQRAEVKVTTGELPFLAKSYVYDELFNDNERRYTILEIWHRSKAGPSAEAQQIVKKALANAKEPAVFHLALVFLGAPKHGMPATRGLAGGEELPSDGSDGGLVVRGLQLAGCTTEQIDAAQRVASRNDALGVVCKP